jgi:HlyD family secretion protein
MRIPLKLFPLLAVALALLAAALVLSSRPAANAPPAVQLAPASRMAIRPAGDGVDGDIVALGRVEPVSRVLKVAGPSGDDAGRVAVLSVAEGQRVSRGQVMAVLDTEPRLAAALAQARANVATKKAQLAQKLSEIENSEKSLSAAVEQQVAERDRVQWEADRHAKLTTAGLYSQPALIDKRLALLSANHKLEASKIALERILARDANGVRLEEAVVRAELAAAEAGAEKARLDHMLSRIQAPIDGTVLRLFARLGQQIGSEGFAELGDVSTMMVRAEVFEADVAGVAQGQPVSVTSRALEEPLHGTVHRVGWTVGTQSIIRGDPAAVLDSRVVDVFILLDRTSSARVAGLTNLQVRVAIHRRMQPPGRVSREFSRAD